MLKSKNLPVLPENPPVVSEKSSFLSEERLLRVNPDVDRRLTQFMQTNATGTDYYSKLVKENPDRAVRAFMLNKMFKYEAELRVVERQVPQAREWLDQQSPEVKQRIAERLEKVNPAYRQQTAVRLIAQEKTRLDFKPKIAASQSISI